MLEIIKEYIKHLNRVRKNNIDVSQFNDEIANLTDWESLNTVTSNFNTRQLIKVNKDILKYKTTIGMKLFSGVFMAAGAICLAISWPSQDGRWLPHSFAGEGLGELVCLVFFVLGAAMLYFSSSPIVFDGKKRALFKGRGKKIKTTYFSEIYALQLIPNYVSDSDGDNYYNYQLNIVFSDGRRVNIVSYYNADKARKDSKTVSNFIDKKLWDALT